MYGLVNQGIRKMVTDNFGEEKWEEIRNEAGTDDVFVGMDPYPDETTVSLVGAASKVLDIPAPDVLKAFGRWWINFAAVEYDHLFSMAGNTFIEFLENLNDIHTRVGYMLPKLTPPAFQIHQRTEDTLTFCYYSKRRGLYSMVLGMIEGIAEHFGEQVEVSHIGGIENGLDHDRYLIHLQSTKGPEAG